MSEDPINRGRPETLTTLPTLTKKNPWKVLSRTAKHGLEPMYEFFQRPQAELIKDDNSLFGFLLCSVVSRGHSRIIKSPRALTNRSVPVFDEYLRPLKPHFRQEFANFERPTNPVLSRVGRSYEGEKNE